MENAQSILWKKFDFSFGVHRDMDVIWIKFPNDRVLLKFLKTQAKVSWSSSNKCWYALDKNVYRSRFGLEQKMIGKRMMLKIHPANQKAFQEFQNMIILKGFSANTLRSYSVEFAQLLYILGDYPVENLTANRLKSYFLYCIKELHLTENYLHSRINAVKFYYEKVLRRENFFIDIPRPKKPLLLPKSLNVTEVSKIISVTENPKHKLILQLAYGMGLRVSEIVRIKLEDIDSKTMRVLISSSKGKKDRYVNLPESILESLREYYKQYLPKIYLFEGQSGDQYAIRSAQAIFKNAMKKAGIRKTVGIHSLRHSYATHLLEYGTDISLIQKLLGHNSIKTTLTYTKVTDRFLSKVASPLDKL